MNKQYSTLLEKIDLKIRETDIFSDIKNIKELNDYLTNEFEILKSQVKKNGFSTEKEEIYFFKHIKPQILSKLFFFSKIFRIEIQAPPPNGCMINYFEEIQQELNKNFTKTMRSSDFYLYWRTKAEHKDKEYFLRKNQKMNSYQRSFAFEVDTEFSTYYDNTIAHYLCEEMLHEYLTKRIYHFKNNENIIRAINNTEWTGTKTDLVELIYALHETKNIEKGTLSIHKTIQLFESFFKIDLGDAYHTFHRMKQRANSRTLFLDKLKSSLEQLMDKSDL